MATKKMKKSKKQKEPNSKWFSPDFSVNSCQFLGNNPRSSPKCDSDPASVGSLYIKRKSWPYGYEAASWPTDILGGYARERKNPHSKYIMMMIINGTKEIALATDYDEANMVYNIRSGIAFLAMQLTPKYANSKETRYPILHIQTPPRYINYLISLLYENDWGYDLWQFYYFFYNQKKKKKNWFFGMNSMHPKIKFDDILLAPITVNQSLIR
jgi:hypothetical protein